MGGCFLAHGLGVEGKLEVGVDDCERTTNFFFGGDELGHACRCRTILEGGESIRNHCDARRSLMHRCGSLSATAKRWALCPNSEVRNDKRGRIVALGVFDHARERAQHVAQVGPLTHDGVVEGKWLFSEVLVHCLLCGLELLRKLSLDAGFGIDDEVFHRVQVRLAHAHVCDL